MQGVDDDQPCFRVLAEEPPDLQLQPGADAAALGLEIQPAGRGGVGQPEQPCLYPGKGILKAEVKHRLRLDGPVPDTAALREP